MANFLAYLIAIVVVYRKYLLALLAVIIVTGYFLYSPAVERAVDERLEPVPPQSHESYQPQPTSSDQPGRRYASLEELNAAERAGGYLPIGYFGNNWPAVVTEVLTDDDSIEFVRKDGVKHRYTGFAGYQLKAVRLVTAENSENLIVFRSERKR